MSDRLATSGFGCKGCYNLNEEEINDIGMPKFYICRGMILDKDLTVGHEESSITISYPVICSAEYIELLNERPKWCPLDNKE